jgi:hypothetical protein
VCATFVVALFEVRRFCDRHRLLNACTGSPGPDLRKVRHAGPVVQVRIVESVVPVVNVDLPADIDLGISTALAQRDPVQHHNCGGVSFAACGTRIRLCGSRESPAAHQRVVAGLLFTTASVAAFAVGPHR